ncbi:MAG: choice-of-anchor J domain-containing protein [Bacteroidota bacterium]
MRANIILLSSVILLMYSALTMAGPTAPVYSADIIRMDFESLPDFSLNLGPWISADLDHHPTYGIQNHSFPNDTVAKAFMCFNPSAVTPPMGDSAPSSFTAISGSQALRAPLAWTKKTIDLSGFKNQDVYLAVQCVSNDHFIFMVDDIQIITNSSGAFPSSASLDFEQLANFTLDLSPWLTVDVNGGATYTMVSGSTQIVFPHSGQPMSYICFNPAATVPAEQFMKPHSGLKLGCCFSSMPPRNPNNKWLISPRLTLGTSSILDLWVMTYDPKYMESYNIAVSVTDADPTSFVNLKTTPDTAPAAWTHRYYDLKDYNNKTVYVAIQCISDDKFIFMVDDIRITSIEGIEDDHENFRLSVYPNPARGFIYFASSLPAGTPLRIRLVNMTGAVKCNREFDGSPGTGVMDVHDLSPGLYTLLAEAGGRISVQKIIIQ